MDKSSVKKYDHITVTIIVIITIYIFIIHFTPQHLTGLKICLFIISVMNDLMESVLRRHYFQDKDTFSVYDLTQIYSFHLHVIYAYFININQSS